MAKHALGWRTTIREMIELQMQWWRRENAVPLVGTFAPVAYPSGGLDLNVKPSEVLDRKLGNLHAERVVPQDSVPVAFVDFGTAFVPALAGAGIEYDGHTSWSIPCATSAIELRIRPFDAGHPLWLKYVELFKPLLQHWSWDTYLPGLCAMVGPMDVLSAMLGPQTLAMELYENPEAVQACAMDAARLCRAALDMLLGMLRDAGLREGTADWMRIWMPGASTCYSEDFSALCGEEHFRRFFLSADAAFIGGLRSPFLHLHSGGLRCLPGVLDVPNLRAIELSHDPSGPSLETICAAARRIQSAGLAVQISNWQHPLQRDEIELILDSVDPRGLKITLQAQSIAEAESLYAFVQSPRVFQTTH